MLKNPIFIIQTILEITDNLAGNSYVTGSAILPVISSLRSKLSEITETIESGEGFIDINGWQIKNMYKTNIEVLDQRYENNTMLIMCTVLDPRFKIEYIKHDDISVLKETIREFCKTSFKSTENDGYVNDKPNH